MFDDPKPDDKVNMTVREFVLWADMEKAAQKHSKDNTEESRCVLIESLRKLKESRAGFSKSCNSAVD